MTPTAIYTLAVLAVAVAVMAAEWTGPDVVLFTALVALVAGGVLEMEAALAGFANPVLATIAGLLVIAAGLRATGVLERAADRVLGDGRSARGALGRLSASTAGASAFVSNTAVVAMGIPAVTSWARRRGISPSRLLMPLSYASILGGVCTLIGTSTNLLADGLLQSHGLAGLGFFEMAVVGLPCAAAGLAYLVVAAPRLLPRREEEAELGERAREYLAALRVTDGAPLAGRTVEAAGLRRLDGLYLVRVERAEGTVAPVDPEERLAAGDRLVFAGVTERIAELRGRRGLAPAVGPNEAAGAEGPDAGGYELHEAVVSPSSPLVGTSVREAAFRARYNAAVLAVHRHGERIRKRIGDIVLRPGDTLLLEATPGFGEAHRDSPDFYLTSRVEAAGASAERDGRGGRAVAVLAGMVAAAASGLVPVSLAAVAGGLAMVGLGCLEAGEARRAVDWSVLVVIGCSLGLARGLEASGAAELLGGGLAAAAGTVGPGGLLLLALASTMALTELVTNNAAVALAFPVVLSAAAAAPAADARAALLAVTAAASLSFSTPIGYQTNLMVYGPGGYRFTDFTRVGLPLQLLLLGVAWASLTWLYPAVG